MYKIGDVEVTVINEVVSRSSDVTDRSVEGSSVSDNVKKLPDTVTLDGVVGSNGWDKLKILTQYQRNGSLLTYAGKNTYSNMVLELFETEHNSNFIDGFTFSAILKQIFTARTKLVSAVVSDEDKPQVKVMTDAGLQAIKQNELSRMEANYNAYRNK